MTAIIPATRGETCIICLEGFTDSNPPFTHKGGEGHDGLHKTCLTSWCVKSRTCPYEANPIDPSSILSRTDRIRASLSCFSAKNCLIGGASIAVGGFLLTVCGVAKALIGTKTEVVDREAVRSGLDFITKGIAMTVIGAFVVTAAAIKIDREHAD